MSMDDTHAALIGFRKKLQSFNEELAISHRDLKQRHEAVAPLWQDAASRHYHKLYDPLEQQLELYLSHSAPQFEDIMRQKIADLDSYLKGGL